MNRGGRLRGRAATSFALAARMAGVAVRIAWAAAVSAAFLASAGAKARRRAAIRASRPISSIKSLVSIAMRSGAFIVRASWLLPVSRSAGKGISSAPAQRHVVAMDQFVAAAEAEDRLDLSRALADDATASPTL